MCVYTDVEYIDIVASKSVNWFSWLIAAQLLSVGRDLWEQSKVGNCQFMCVCQQKYICYW